MASALTVHSGRRPTSIFYDLAAAWDKLGLDADAYAAEQSLVGLTLEKEAAAVEELEPARATFVRHAWSGMSGPFIKMLGDIDAARPQAMVAATKVHAAARGHLVRLSLLEARSLYGFGTSPPPNICLRRIRGGARYFDFACCARASTRAAPAIPFTLSEALALFPLQTTAPDTLQA